MAALRAATFGTCPGQGNRQELAQRLELRFRIFHQSIVIEVEDVAGKFAFPMRHQAPVLPVKVADIPEIQGVTHLLLKVQEENGQAIIQCIARRMHDLGIRETGA